MKTQSLRPNTLFPTLACCLLSLLIGPAKAGTIAQSPLFISSALDPNLVFIIDDSGSMNASYLPDTICTSTDLRTSKRAYSSTINGLAYNPNTIYTPPLDQNGNSLGNSPFNAAWKNGYALPHPTSGTIAAGGARVNLSSQYQPTWSYSGTGCSDSTEYNGTAQAAYYYQYTPGITNCNNSTNPTSTAYISINNENCYSKITVGASEQQNFANWYSYYRTRIMTVKGAASRAFATLGNTIRVGWGRINNGTRTTIDGKSVDTVMHGVRPFTGSDRQAFFTDLFNMTASGSTPTRRAMDSVGYYYENESTAGPWSSTPGTTGGNLYACRKSFMVLMTDGYWNSSAGSYAPATNIDGTNSSWTSSDGTSFSYVAASPFKDSYSNTLADIAMYYWKRDLCPNVANKVPKSQYDQAFWQHMNLYAIGLGVPLTGTYPIDPFAAIVSGGNVTWPDPQTGSSATSVPQRIDDLEHAAVNGHGGYLAANDSTQFVQAMNATLSSITDINRSSSSATATNSTSLQGDTLIYQATFNPVDWSGKLSAYPIDSSGINSATANWEASAKLPAPAQYTDRKIFTLNPSVSRSDTTNPHGSVFDWDTGLSADQKTALNTLSSVVDTNGKGRSEWLRGDNSKEIPYPVPVTPVPGKIFRTRTSGLLGDIVNSDPIFVGSQDYGYGSLNGYSSFVSGKSSRTPTLYVGANDGMLHAFDARENNNPTTNITTGGSELFAYVPNLLFSQLSKLTVPSYVHQYYVDGPIGVGDAYFNGSWHTMLVGTTGAGGQGIFALDINNPESFNVGNVLWEFTNADDSSDLGYTLAQASIVRTNDPAHEWVVIIGNGYGSSNGHAVLMLLDAQTGARIGKIDTGVGNGSSKNGLSSPLTVDTNNDQKIDVVYAGDLYGNLWKFDFSGSLSNWKVASFAGVTGPLFVACDSIGAPCPTGHTQPITTKPNAGAVGTDQSGGLMIYFGTGKYFEVGDNMISGTPQIQTFYGLWDNGNQILNRANLQEQSIIYEGFPTVGGSTSKNKQRIVSSNPVCYSNASNSACLPIPPNTAKRGWALNLETATATIPTTLTPKGERSVSYPLVRRGLVVFSTIIPDPDPCKSGGEGWIMEVDAHTGGAPTSPPFDVNNDNLANSADKVVIGTTTYVTAGMNVDIGLHKTPSVVESVGVDYKYLSGSSGTIGRVVDAGVFPPATPTPNPAPAGARQAWRQLR